MSLEKSIKKHWKWWLLGAIALIFIMWILNGRKKYEFVGLKPFFREGSHNPWEPDISVSFNTTKSDEDESGSDDRKDKSRVRIRPRNDCRRPRQKSISFVPTNRAYASKGEATACQAIERIYEKQFIKIRPDWLKNPETGRNLELDCFNNELKIAVEYNGAQHYKYPNNFHKTEHEFLQQARRDIFKRERCDANGVYLISVPYNIPVDEIEQYIRDKLPDKSVCE